MDDGLKQRLVGAIVLLALAVIFLPVVFDREPMEPIDSRSLIPPAPEISVADIPEPVTPEWVQAEPEKGQEPEQEPEVILTPKETTAKPAAREPKAVVKTDEQKSWVLQVASFRSDEHANNLRTRLTELGYSAYTRKVGYKNGDITRVYVGPKLSQEDLKKAKVVIDRELKVNSLILAFTPG